MKETNDYLIDYFQKFDNTYEHYDNYCFIGTTLWSKITNPEYTFYPNISNGK